MPPVLSIGSIGPFVIELQNALNSLPSTLAKLADDGAFGPKTKARVVEFQNQHKLSPDGVVGPLTWEQLLHFATLVKGEFQNNLGRMAVVGIAEAEASLPGVAAKLSGGLDPKKPGKHFRQGHARLLKYFKLSAPGVFMEDNIRYLAKQGELHPMPHWCGIFALWAVKTSGMAVGTWKQGSGISSVTGFRQIGAASVAAGDVGYVDKPFEHHFIIKQVFDKGGVRTAATIEGNSAPNSNFSFQDRPLSAIDRFYSCF